MPRKKRKVKIYTLDTETIGLDGEIKRIALYDGQDIIYGYTFDDVEPVLIKAFKDGLSPHVYIHNLEFDARKIPKVFEKGNVLWSQTKIINNRYVKIVCKKYTLHDSFALLPESLSSLSKSFDLEHGKLDLWDEVQKVYPNEYKNHVDFLNRCDKDNPLYLKYLGFDVISLYELIDKLCDVAGITHDIIVNTMTTASLSRYIFKNGYKGLQFKAENGSKTDFEILVSNKAWSSNKKIKSSRHDISYADIEEIIRKSYHGGRTEVFKPHAIPQSDKVVAFHYDVNSEYPAVMKNKMEFSGVTIGRDFPVGFCNYYEDEAEAEYYFNKWLDTHEGLGFLEATLYIPKQDIPPLPVKMGKLVFPCGYVKGVFTNIELEYAIKNCGVKILKYHKYIDFPTTFPVFERFITVFSEMKSKAKANGEKALEKFSKLLQNTAYGWTALRRDDKTELNYIEKIDDYEDRLIYSNEELGYIEIQSIVHTETIQVQVASYVTAYARILLLDTLRKQAKKGAVYYCDTDSIVCECPLDDEAVHKSQLGKWDLEREIIEGIFLQPKVYVENDKVKFKGISKERQKSLNTDFYKLILNELKTGTNSRMLVEENIERLRSIKHAQKKGKDLNELEHLDKFINLDNKQKRQMFYSDNYTLPWYFASIEEFESFNFNVDYSPYLNEEGYLMDFARGIKNE